MRGRIVDALEWLLWQSRLTTLIAVGAGILLGLGVMLVTAADVWLLLGNLAGYLAGGLTSDQRSTIRLEIVTEVVKAMDGFLIASILLLFSLGIYELFINRIGSAESSEVGPRLLRINSLDDLKDRVAKLVVLVLVIEFFQAALKMKHGSAQDLLYLAVGIFLVGAALAVTGKKSEKTPAEAVPSARE